MTKSDMSTFHFSLYWISSGVSARGLYSSKILLQTGGIHLMIVEVCVRVRACVRTHAIRSRMRSITFRW